MFLHEEHEVKWRLMGRWINDPVQNTKERLYYLSCCIALLVNRLTVSIASMNSLFSNRSLVSDLCPLIFVKYILGKWPLVMVLDFPELFNWTIPRCT